MENWFSCNSTVGYHIATKLCTCHDSTAVMLCAKFRSDHFTAWMKAEWNSHSMKISFVKWAFALSPRFALPFSKCSRGPQQCGSSAAEFYIHSHLMGASSLPNSTHHWIQLLLLQGNHGDGMLNPWWCHDIYCKISSISHTKSKNLIFWLSALAVVFAQSTEARC